MVILLVAITVATGLVVLLRPWPFFLTREQSHELNQRNAAAEFGKWVEMRASAHGLNVRGVARPVPLECPKCGKNLRITLSTRTKSVIVAGARASVGIPSPPSSTG